MPGGLILKIKMRPLHEIKADTASYDAVLGLNIIHLGNLRLSPQYKMMRSLSRFTSYESLI